MITIPLSQSINQIYEITGISDIVRGQTAASETATAQQIKGQYAGLRLRAMQEDVALFASELFQLKAQVICTKFQPSTILQYAAAQAMNPADQALIPQALMLLQDKPLRNFRIQVDSDSLVQIDENQNKRDRTEFLQAMGGFLTQALPMGQQAPELVPMLIELVKFGVGAYKKAEPIEGAIDQAMDQMKQKQQQIAANPTPPPPSPEMVKMQGQQQIEQMKMQATAQADQLRVQADAQNAQTQAQFEMQVEQMKMQAEAQLESQKQQFEMALANQELQVKERQERYKSELDAATKITIALLSANPDSSVEEANAQATQLTNQISQNINNAMAQMTASSDNMAAMHGQTLAHLGEAVKSLTSPKRVIRGSDGRVVGVEVAQ